jgi:zinc protease
MLPLLLTGAAPQGVFPYAYSSQTLPNGLRVVMIPMPADGLMSYYSVVRTGSRDEYEPGHSGFAHFFEHMMFRGTEQISAEELNRIATTLGADTNAYTTNDYTAYYLNFGSADLARVVEIEADRFQHLAYAEREFQTESGAIYGEFRKGRTDPYAVLDEVMSNTAYDVHTYKHTTIGFERDIKAMPTMFDYSRSFFRRYYRPENVVLLLTGDFDPTRAMALIQQHYAGWQRGYVAPEIPVEPEQKGERRAQARYEGQTLPMLAVGWKCPAFDPKSVDVAAGRVLGELLFGQTSPLYADLVLDRRVVQELYTSFTSDRDPSLWGVVASVTDEGKLAEVEAAIERAVAALVAAPPEPRRVDDLKRHLRYAFLLGLDTPASVNARLARFVAHTGDVAAVDTWFATLAAVTPADVQRVAARVLTRAHRTVVTLKGVQP